MSSHPDLFCILIHMPSAGGSQMSPHHLQPQGAKNAEPCVRAAIIEVLIC